MSNIDIRIRGLSKKYQLGKRASYKTFRASIAQVFHSSIDRFSSASKPESNPDDQIWALRGIDLDIEKGELVGIVGRNGAGKTTLLKILSRITEPTEGFAEVRGTASALLEVGTGFHNELTGRENIYLNGSILGMKRQEIQQKFDKIVEFSGIGKFLDTPVKHYSSGMRVRLAFAVGAHLRPNILFIDEVLAVGDFEFQQKCLIKMKEVARDGRTVLFVSHNLTAIKELCKSCIFLEHGELKYHAPVDEGLAKYFLSFTDDSMEMDSAGGWWDLSVESDSGSSSSVSSNRPFCAYGNLKLSEDFTEGHLFVKIKDSLGNAIVRERVNAREVFSDKITAGTYRVSVELPTLWLAPGIYVVFFRFIGRNQKGEEIRITSPEAMLNVSGNFRGMHYSRIFLHPPLLWKMNYSKSSIPTGV
jgi:lipopolysaccharide transport system ATP-binding protein